MEVYFIDIGSGTSNLILLGQGRAIVIDCGENSGTLLQLLTRFQVQEIVRLVVSHNHDDHAGGAVGVLDAFEGRIEKIAFVQDGSLSVTKFSRKIWRQLRDQIIRFDQLFRLECDDQPKILYEEKPRKLSLKILSPRFGDNLEAVEEGKPNATSGVLVLTIEDKRIVFAGDSIIRQWRRIREARKKPLACDLLSVAHHGGTVAGSLQDLQWLYTEGVRPQYAVVSVATSNIHRHPRPDVIKTITSTGSTIVCTQITSQCCDDLEKLRPGVLTPELPGRSQPNLDRTTAGNSRNVACGGTLVAEFVNSQLNLDRFLKHQTAIEALAKTEGFHPLCR